MGKHQEQTSGEVVYPENGSCTHNAPADRVVNQLVFNQIQCSYRFTSTVFTRSHSLRLLFVPEMKNETEGEKKKIGGSRHDDKT